MLSTIKAWIGFVLIMAFLTGATMGLHVLTTRYTRIVVANVNLSPGMRLTDGLGLVGLRVRSVATVPSGAVHTLEGVHGMYVRENITKGEPVLSSSLTAETPPARKPRPGYFFFEISTFRENAANLWVGDMVHVHINFVDGTRMVLKDDWVIAAMDYDDPELRSIGLVDIAFEKKNTFVWPGPTGLAAQGGSRMVRSDSRGD